MYNKIITLTKGRILNKLLKNRVNQLIREAQEDFAVHTKIKRIRIVDLENLQPIMKEKNLTSEEAKIYLSAYSGTFTF